MLLRAALGALVMWGAVYLAGAFIMLEWSWVETTFQTSGGRFALLYFGLGIGGFGALMGMVAPLLRE